ncbi:MAG TPA: hypothetical protein O0X27_05795, partial [Methanocorpusculum sp.]|nr:hypothetical protein [Methanocorpusculum sp.]
NSFMNSVKNFLNGKPRDSSKPLTSTKTYFRILIVLIIVAIVLTGVVFAINYSAYVADKTPVVTPMETPTPVPTAIPTQIPTVVPTPSSSVSTGEIAGDIQVVGTGINANTTVEEVTALEPWVMNTSEYVQDTAAISYLTVYQYDTETGLLIFVDKFMLLAGEPAVIRTYPAGIYPILVSTDASAELTNEAYSAYCALLKTPPSGSLFVATADDSYVPSDSLWKLAATLNLDKAAWKFHEVAITVKPATPKQTAANGGWNTITIQYPWRIVWKITGTDDVSSPYANAEFVLSNLDGSVVDRFGWKGFYSSNTEQISNVYQPGEYVLAIYQRGCGISLEFQHAYGPVLVGNSTVISTEGT